MPLSWTMVCNILYVKSRLEYDKNSNSVSFVSERYFSTVVHPNDGMDTDMGGPGSSGSHTPPSRHGASPVTNKPQNAA